MNRAPEADGWVSLSDAQWMNIVNHEHAYYDYSKDDAVHAAVKATEAKLRELNVAAAPAAVVQAEPSEWISVAERLPKVGDYSVLAFWSMNGGFDMIHVEQYFADITNGVDDTGKQLYTKWYLQMGVTHWMPLPKAPA